MTVDTNVLVRVLTNDDEAQAEKATDFLTLHEPVVTNQVFCELLWVLARVYRFSRSELSQAVRAIINTESVIFDAPAVAAGLEFLESGGDFADAVIAVEGERFQAETFVTFDRDAARRFSASRRPCINLNAP
ncbi:type II toxin-antitoxin system VapC family toxin [Rhizobium sp. RU36D]|uniref:type II toxin-antitoxin system VapC family toxin n=1 Tax=Rhizobium sp. RU36D TaxID=1907415 RepID=UPI00117B5225|nr:type II toxin-antitoxin system VapC family toxin [Rhizobium sp. RU36D]